MREAEKRGELNETTGVLRTWHLLPGGFGSESPEHILRTAFQTFNFMGEQLPVTLQFSSYIGFKKARRPLSLPS